MPDTAPFEIAKPESLPHDAPTGAKAESLWREISAQAHEFASRAPDVTEEELTEMIDEAIKAVRSQRR